MDQEPATPPPDDSGGKPKIFQNINGMIAGLTGLVVAVGGLAAATKGVVWDKEPARAEIAAVADPAGAAQPEAADVAAEPDEGDPTVYEGGGVRMEWTGEEWLLTGRDGEYHYEEVVSTDETRVLAYDKANKAYIRWPINGGMSEEGSEDKTSWTTYVALEPVEE